MKLITLDFETAYSTEYSLSKMSTEDYILDDRFEIIGVSIMVDDAAPVWYASTPGNTLESMRSVIAPYFAEPAALLAQNAMFDATILTTLMDIHPALFIDLMFMANVYVKPSTGSSSLAAICKYLEIGEKGGYVASAKGKWRTDFTEDELKLYAEYCCNDSLKTYLAYKILMLSFPKKEILSMDRTIRMYQYPQLELDAERVAIHLNRVKEEKERLLENLPMGYSKKDLTSSSKFKTMLEELGIEVPMKPSPAIEGKMIPALAKTDEGMKELLEHGNPLVQSLAAARLGHQSTQEQSRAERFLKIANDHKKLRVPLNCYAARTHRYGGWQKINLQNLGRKSPLRSAIVAPPGYKVIAGDLSQIEARANAVISGQWDLVEQFANNVDVYAEFASKLYYKPITKKDFPVERFVGKVGILSLGYGAGWEAFQRMCRLEGVTMSEEASLQVVSAYRNTYSAIVQNWTKGEEIISAMGLGQKRTWAGCKTYRNSIVMPSGLPMFYSGLHYVDAQDFKVRGWSYFHGKKLTRLWGSKMVENFTQSLTRDIINEMMIKVSRRYPILLQVHDELVTVAPDAEVAEAEAYMREIMSTPPTWMPELPVACEVSSAQNYGDIDK